MIPVWHKISKKSTRARTESGPAHEAPGTTNVDDSDGEQSNDEPYEWVPAPEQLDDAKRMYGDQPMTFAVTRPPSNRGPLPQDWIDFLKADVLKSAQTERESPSSDAG